MLFFDFTHCIRRKTYVMILTQQDRVNNLGVWFDSEQNFAFHYNQIITKAYRMLGFLIRVTKPFQNPKLFSSLARSQLEL